MTEYPNWYRRAEVAFKLINYTFNREVCIIMPNYLGDIKFKVTRMMRIHNTHHLKVWLDSMHILDGTREYGLYYSLARYKDGIPYSTLRLTDRDFSDWNQNNWKEIVSYDCVIDVDCNNHKEIDFVYYSAKEIKKLFDKLNVPYYIRFSGMGFHFIIPFQYFKDSGIGISFNHSDDDSIYKSFMRIAMGLHNNYSELVDTTIYDSRRVVKMPFSIALYDGKEYLCKPFGSDDDFNGFVLKSMNPSHFLGHVRFMDDKLFNPEGNVVKLLKELEIKNV